MGHFYAIFSWKLGLTRRFRCAKFNTFPKSHTFVLVHKCAITFFLCYLYIVLYALLVLYVVYVYGIYIYPAKNRALYAMRHCPIAYIACVRPCVPF